MRDLACFNAYEMPGDIGLSIDEGIAYSIGRAVARKGGIVVKSKTGHAFKKQTLRAREAVYGGKLSAHH